MSRLRSALLVVGPGPLFVLAAFGLPASFVIWCLVQFGFTGGITLAVLALVPIAVASVRGSQGVMMWGVGAAIAGFIGEDGLGLVAQAIGGAVMFAATMLQDWSRSMRRNPVIAPGLLQRPLALGLLVIVAGWLIAGLAYVVAGVGEWPSIAIPVAVVAVGVAALVLFERLLQRNERG